MTRRSDDGNGTVVFQPRARFLRFLGEELISDEIIAISELVKNCHDADARGCVIRFVSLARAASEITIEDDGRAGGKAA